MEYINIIFGMLYDYKYCTIRKLKTVCFYYIMDIHPPGPLLSTICSANVTHFSVKCSLVHLPVTKCYKEEKKLCFWLLTLTISVMYFNF